MGSMGTKGSTRKGNVGWKGSTWEERVEGCEEIRWRRDLERACSKGFWERKCEIKREVRGNLKEAREKKEVRKYGTRHKQDNNRWQRNRKESKRSYGISDS